MARKKTAAVQKPAPEPKPAPPPEPKKEVDPADVLWDKIKDLPLELYSLPNQTLAGNCTRVKIAPNQLHLRLSSGAVISAMTEALKNVKIPDDEAFDITAVGSFTVVQLKKKYLL